MRPNRRNICNRCGQHNLNELPHVCMEPPMDYFSSSENSSNDSVGSGIDFEDPAASNSDPDSVLCPQCSCMVKIEEVEDHTLAHELSENPSEDNRSYRNHRDHSNHRNHRNQRSNPFPEQIDLFEDLMSRHRNHRNHVNQRSGPFSEQLDPFEDFMSHFFGTPSGFPVSPGMVPPGRYIRIVRRNASRGPSSGQELDVHDWNRSDSQNCTICLEDFSAGDKYITLPCFHNFHENCIKNWLRQSNQCPICKHRVN